MVRPRRAGGYRGLLACMSAEMREWGRGSVGGVCGVLAWAWLSWRRDAHAVTRPNVERPRLGECAMRSIAVLPPALMCAALATIVACSGDTPAHR